MVPVRCAFIPYETMVSGVFETMGMGFTALIIGEYPPVAMVSVNINEWLKTDPFFKISLKIDGIRSTEKSA